jgi:hypothetical protein
MSLKAFHVVFITASGLLAAFCAAWAVNQYRAEPSGIYLAGAVVSVASVAALAVYATVFQRKTRNL